MALILQLHNLLPTLTASENVQVPMFETKLGARERRKGQNSCWNLLA